MVSAIEWIPGYGSVLIITHRDNFRTVYGHLTDINVLEGNKVYAGDLIGNVSESLEGSILHFEIWNERNYQNPQDWLVKK
ncbi:MAG: M23 family metallopeptidase [Ignavibacteriales bacterium]|nr:M23 family metallopeptidase [Ignavibacteriales bacterium]